jgi:hypothetical protein
MIFGIAALMWLILGVGGSVTGDDAFMVIGFINAMICITGFLLQNKDVEEE